MSGSRLNPRLSYKTGAEETGGYIRKNEGPKSANSPDWRGMFYLVGYGWVWLSGWSRDSNGLPLIRLLGEDMTDEQAKRFCAPKAPRGGRQTTRTPTAQHNGQTPSASAEDEIPF